MTTFNPFSGRGWMGGGGGVRRGGGGGERSEPLDG